MLTTNTEKVRREVSRVTTVNRVALTAWLQAWTTGTSFPTLSPMSLESRQGDKEQLALLHHVRPKTTEQA